MLRRKLWPVPRTSRSAKVQRHMPGQQRACSLTDDPEIAESQLRMLAKSEPQGEPD